MRWKRSLPHLRCHSSRAKELSYAATVVSVVIPIARLSKIWRRSSIGADGRAAPANGFGSVFCLTTARDSDCLIHGKPWDAPSTFDLNAKRLGQKVGVGDLNLLLLSCPQSSYVILYSTMSELLFNESKHYW